jgi:translation initiation factor IF-2
VLVRQGTLKVGDLVVCGTEYGRIKALFDDMKRPLKEAGPSQPVQILGLPGVVEAGEELVVVEQEKDARAVVEYRQASHKKSKIVSAPVKLENFFANSSQKELAVILKADTHGSIEAIAQSLIKLSTDEVQLKIVAQSVGGITDSDVMLAKASHAMILGFNVRAEKSSKLLAEKEQVAIEYYSIIYEMINHVKSAIFGLEAPKYQETFVGLAEVRSVFRSSVFGHIAGCLVVEGVVRKDLPIRILRQNVVIYQGRLESLRRHKDDVQEVRAGTECGIGVKDYNDIRNGDQIEVYQLVEIARQS